MVFSEYVFVFVFLVVALGVHLLTPRRWRLIPLTLLSYLFYGWVRFDFCLIMLGSTLLDYCVGGLIPTRKEMRSKKLLLCVSICGNLGLLGYFKYRGFFVANINSVAAQLGLGQIEVADLVLPIGISFYTFQSMSYTIDVYRGQLNAERNFWRFAAYISMFPQLVAGPIVRLRDLRGQLNRPGASWDSFASGAFLFMLGLSKKVLVADSVAGFADQFFDLGGGNAINAWAGLLAFAVQIYFDFSGYSDMAIGLGAMLGFRFPQNFDSPYKSASITEFWRRWHITLGSWFRDYLYIPLGGNRHGPMRTGFNRLSVFFLCGLWHGAQWTFVVWGLYHGLLLALERVTRWSERRRARMGRQALTFLLVILGWVPFRANSLSEALEVLGDLVGRRGLGEFSLSPFVDPSLGVTALGSGLLLAFLAPNTEWLRQRLTPARAALAVVLFCFSLLTILYQDDRPFLYFRF